MTALTFAHLREVNVRRQGPDGWRHLIRDWSFDDWFVATAGELGEALNVIKKLNRARDGLIGNTRTVDQLKVDLADELADAVLYLDLLMARVDATFEQMLGDRDFTELRNLTAAHPDERSPSTLGRVAIKCLAAVSDENGSGAGLVLQRLDDIAFFYGIDLGAAVIAKFNATSEKHGMPHRLAA